MHILYFCSRLPTVGTSAYDWLKICAHVLYVLLTSKNVSLLFKLVSADSAMLYIIDIKILLVVQIHIS